MEMDIKKVAGLAHIKLSPEEEKKIEKDLESILKYVESLKSLDTENVEPTSHVLDMENVFRKDEVVKWDGRDEVLKNAPQSEGKFFKVPKVVDKEN